MSRNPADEHPTTDEPLPMPDAVLAWEEHVNNMTWEEFCHFLEEGEDGLAFGGV